VDVSPESAFSVCSYMAILHMTWRTTEMCSREKSKMCFCNQMLQLGFWQQKGLTAFMTLSTAKIIWHWW